MICVEKKPIIVIAKKIYHRIFPKSLRIRIRKVTIPIKKLCFRVDNLLFPQKNIWFCPCCGFRFRFFKDCDCKEYPNIYNPERYKNTRQDVQCPVCSSLPRHRILASWCDDHKELLDSSNILYFAPEYCMMNWMKRNGVSCTTADLYESADLNIDIQATGLSDESYDMIFCNHVLEHVDDFRKALTELYRILKQDGYLICSFPIDLKVESLDEASYDLTIQEQFRRFGQLDHKRVFGMNAGKLLEEAGYKVERILGEDYPDVILPIVGPADYDMNCLFCCQK